MRTEQQMMELILSTAEQDERIRAVAMNGSRTNPNVPKDIFQDYDIVYLVTEMDSFIGQTEWVDRFGELVIIQRPDDNDAIESMAESRNRYAYLMQFADGNRIDLTLIPVSDVDAYVKEDKLTIILLDKDHILPVLPAPTDQEYWVKRPSADQYRVCCNEFWWVSTYAAKGLWRKEILYVQDHLNLYVRPMLIKMLEWRAGIDTDFSVSVGKCGKYLDKYLPEPIWQKLLATYADGSYDASWRALFAMGELFRTTAEYVAKHMQFQYNIEEDTRVSAYIKHIEQLPSEASEIY